MPWIVGGYIALMIALGVFTTLDDRRDGRSAGYLIVDAGVTALWMYFVVAYFYASVAAPLGRTIAVPLVFAVCWTVADAWREIRLLPEARSISDDPELSPGANLIIDWIIEAASVLVGVLVIAPAVVFAVLVVHRAW